MRITSHHILLLLVIMNIFMLGLLWFISAGEEVTSLPDMRPEEIWLCDMDKMLYRNIGHFIS